MHGTVCCYESKQHRIDKRYFVKKWENSKTKPNYPGQHRQYYCRVCGRVRTLLYTRSGPLLLDHPGPPGTPHRRILSGHAWVK